MRAGAHLPRWLWHDQSHMHVQPAVNINNHCEMRIVMLSEASTTDDCNVIHMYVHVHAVCRNQATFGIGALHKSTYTMF